MTKEFKKLQKSISKVANFEKQLRIAKNRVINVGITADSSTAKNYESGDPVAVIGAQHEFGAPSLGIPKRSFLREPFLRRQSNIDSFLAKQFEQVVNEKQDAMTSLEYSGVWLRNISFKQFRTSGDGRWAKNSPATIAEKGSSKPLIDTGLLQNSVSYTVRKS